MYSQYGQDQFVIDLLRGQRGGYFLDSGASNGVNSSNTLLLEREYGWRGLCVEPNRRLFERLAAIRRCDCVNVCLFDRNENVRFFEAGGQLGGVAEDLAWEQLERAMHVKKIARDAQGRPPLVVRQAQTLRETLDRAGAPAIIDYWSLDVEGSELRLLRSFPFDRYTFRVITVEHNWLPAKRDIRAFLESKGYQFVTTLEIDDCFILPSAFPTRHAFSRCWRRA